MKIAVTPFTVYSITQLSKAGADVFIIGNEKYSNRLVKSFSVIEIKEANKLIKSLGKELYISMNLIIHHSDIESFTEFLTFVKELDVDGIIFADPAAYMIARELGITAKLVYNPETLNTNYYDTSFWARKGIKGITISKEITLEDIIEICDKKELEVSVIGHGHLNMFHSRRPLIEHYFTHTKEEEKHHERKTNLKIREEHRDEDYPIYQDIHGTHIFRSNSLESFKEVKELSKNVDVFIIEGILKDTEYLITVLTDYKQVLSSDDTELASKISKSYEADHDTGFLHKKTQYDLN